MDSCPVPSENSSTPIHPRGTMKKKHSISTTAVMIFLLTAPLLALSEFTSIQQPDEIQKRVIAGLMQEISSEQRDIQKYYIDLKEKSRIRGNNETEVPLLSETRSDYGTRDRYLYSEEGHIFWKGEQIGSILFLQRRGLIGTGNILTKRISYDVSQGDEAISGDINYIVTEELTSGRGLNVNFRFPAEKETDIRDREENMEVDGIRRMMKIVYVRNVETRISILRENLKMLKLMHRRVDWLIRSENRRNEREIQHLLDTSK